jgi:glycosyltransferase involved in cell wall biosynthesis
VKLALLTEIPAPFRIPLFNALAERPDVDLRVLFLARRDPRRAHYRLHSDEWRFDARVLPGRELRPGGRWTVLSRGVVRELRRFRPDAVAVGGWNQPAFWQALAYARARRIPFLVWIESTARDARSESRPLELAKRLLVRAASGAFVPGRASEEYARSLGVPRARIAIAPNAVDRTLFGERVAALRRPHDGCTFLFVGRLDPEKGLDVLLEAFARLDEGELALVGSGSVAAELARTAPERVTFTGPLDRDSVVEWYARADVFVLPSRSEQWGMVLNEAAAAGLAIVATTAAGAAGELVEDGVNGFLVAPDDVEGLALALSRLAADRAFRERAGGRSRELVAPLTPEAWAEGVAGLAHGTAPRPRTTPGPAGDPTG